MSDQTTPPPTPPSQRSGCASVLLFVFGAILLLPGLCSLVYIGMGGADAEPVVTTIVFVCLLIGVGGVVMIVKAFRR